MFRHAFRGCERRELVEGLGAAPPRGQEWDRTHFSSWEAAQQLLDIVATERTALSFISIVSKVMVSGGIEKLGEMKDTSNKVDGSTRPYIDEWLTFG